MNDLPNTVADLIAGARWIFAKTYADTWPHEYALKKECDSKVFLAFARLISREGESGRFYEMEQRYFKHEGLQYWIMSNPEEATLINRCPISEGYESRLLRGDLPEDRRRRG